MLLSCLRHAVLVVVVVVVKALLLLATTAADRVLLLEEDVGAAAKANVVRTMEVDGKMRSRVVVEEWKRGRRLVMINEVRGFLHIY